MPSPETISPFTENRAGVDPSGVCPWRAFDQIYCITLASRPDRRVAAEREFRSVGLTERVRFIVADRHPSNSEQGIFESHMKCLRAGLAANANRILIFEDDIFFRNFSAQTLRRGVEFLENDSEWFVFFFGCFVRSSKKTAHPSVLKVHYRCSAHAYVVNRTFAERLVQHLWTGVAFDDLLAATNERHAYACYPGIAYQSGASTDNDQQITIDRLRRIFGGVHRQQRWNEFSRHNMKKLVIIHAAILFLMFTIVLLHEMKKF